MLFVSNNKMQRSFGMQSFLTHGRFVSLRNFFSDKNFSTLLPINSCNSDIFSICFFGRLHFFFRAT